MTFHLILGPHDGAKGNIPWPIAPDVVWIYPGGKGPLGLMVSTRRGDGRVPYEKSCVTPLETKYVFAGPPSGLPLDGVPEEEFLNV